MNYKVTQIGTTKLIPAQSNKTLFNRIPPSAPIEVGKNPKGGYSMKKKVLGLVGTLEIELKGTDEIALLELSGQIDSYSAEEITKLIDAHIDNGKFKVIVDLSKVDYLDSAGLSSLINTRIKLSKRGGSLRLVGLKGKAKEVFDLAGLTSMFEIFDSHEKAFEDF